jgi:DNA polymerase-3 subunit delta'
MNLLLHPSTAKQLALLEAAATGSVILHGRAGLGKSTAARELAAKLNCLDGKPGQCTNCRQIAAGNFPDYFWISQGDKASIGIEAVRTVISELALRPYSDKGVRVVVFENAHLLTLEAQNALLKLLEEPPVGTLVLLLAVHLESLLVTVRSRCRTIRFTPPGIEAVEHWLVKSQGQTGPAAAALAVASEGLPGTALTLATNPAEAEAISELARQAGKVGSSSLFERMLLAAKLAAANADLERFGEALQRRLVAETANGNLDPATVSPRLDALERFRLHLSAKVSQRAALERLMLELG